MSPGANVNKLFFSIIYKFSSKAKVFVLGKNFHPRLFTLKASAYLSGAP